MSGSGAPSPLAGQKVAEFSLCPAETIQACGCTIVLRRFEGPKARELFFSCQPPTDLSDAGAQAEAIYCAVLQVLNAEGDTSAAIVCETIFHRNLQQNLEPVREARRRVVAASEQNTFSPAITEIEQAPLAEQAWLELSVQAVVAMKSPVRFKPVTSSSACDCAECARARGLKVEAGDETRLYSGSLFGSGATAYQQTQAMFIRSEKMLQQAGMQFSDVVRTWIYLRDMDRDYPELNRARREFFEERDIVPPPASTGIGAGLVEGHELCLSIYAVKSKGPHQRILMTTHTLNEAPSYGADFSRGIRITEANKEALHVSGTASIDETGKSVHVGDFEAQVDRMLVNVAALLKAQGANFGDVVSAITYLKNPVNAQRLRVKLHEAGYEGFANTLVVAPVCRSELLCETEALAILMK